MTMSSYRALSAPRATSQSRLITASPAKAGTKQQHQAQLSLNVPWQTHRSHVGAFYTADGTHFGYAAAFAMMPTLTIDDDDDPDQAAVRLQKAKHYIEKHVLPPTRRLTQEANHHSSFMGYRRQPDALTLESVAARLNNNVLREKVNPALRKMGFCLHAVTFAQHMGRHGNVLVLRLVQLTKRHTPRVQSQRNVFNARMSSLPTFSLDDGGSSSESSRSWSTGTGSSGQSINNILQRSTSQRSIGSPRKPGSSSSSNNNNNVNLNHYFQGSLGSLSSSSASSWPTSPQSAPPRLSPPSRDSSSPMRRKQQQSQRSVNSPSESSSSSPRRQLSRLFTPRRVVQQKQPRPTASPRQRPKVLPASPSPRSRQRSKQLQHLQQLPVAPFVVNDESSNKENKQKKAQNKMAKQINKSPPTVMAAAGMDIVDATCRNKKQREKTQQQQRQHHSWSAGLEYEEKRNIDNDKTKIEAYNPFGPSIHGSINQDVPSYSSATFSTLLDDLMTELKQQTGTEDGTPSQVKIKKKPSKKTPSRSDTLVHEESNKSLSLDGVFTQSPSVGVNTTPKTMKTSKLTKSKMGHLSAPSLIETTSSPKSDDKSPLSPKSPAKKKKAGSTTVSKKKKKKQSAEKGAKAMGRLQDSNNSLSLDAVFVEGDVIETENDKEETVKPIRKKLQLSSSSMEKKRKTKKAKTSQSSLSPSESKASKTKVKGLLREWKDGMEMMVLSSPSLQSSKKETETKNPPSKSLKRSASKKKATMHSSISSLTSRKEKEAMQLSSSSLENSRKTKKGKLSQ